MQNESESFDDIFSLPVHRQGFPDLLPSQVELYERLALTARSSPITALNYVPGMGASTLLRRLSDEMGGLLLDARQFADEVRAHSILKWEEAVYDALRKGLQHRGVVVVDNFRDVAAYGTIRARLFPNMIKHLSDEAILLGQRLVLSGVLQSSWDTAGRAFGDAATLVAAGALTWEDYFSLFTRELTDSCEDVDFQQVYHSAPSLTLHQLHALINLLRLKLRRGEKLTTALVERVIETRIVESNLHLNEVEALTFDSLPGTEEIAAALETHVILPFRNKSLARELNLKPRRGVLLYGPPGTGKTSIGRALAHRIEGRFFLVDGSFITEPPTFFFAAIDRVISEAKKNAPSVLFIDDADILFQLPHVAGLARYLLSLLDGLESETASNVCIMMTAMDAKKVPAPLLRSGRVELWLETKTPDESLRAQIIKRWIASDMPDAEKVDYGSLSALTAGFTPADLRRLTGDAKLLYASDLHARKAPLASNDYLIAAANELIANRSVMAERLHDDTLRIRAYA